MRSVTKLRIGQMASGQLRIGCDQPDLHLRSQLRRRHLRNCNWCKPFFLALPFKEDLRQWLMAWAKGEGGA